MTQRWFAVGEQGMVDAMTPADEEDSSDPANAPTVVEPLPSHLKRSPCALY
jgi:hypothetical protein